MGNSIDIESRFIPVVMFQEALINLSNIIQNIYMLNVDDRIPIGSASTNITNDLYTYNLREFLPIIKPGGLVEVKRNNYFANDELCCLQDERYGWTNILGQFSQQANLGNMLVTCSPFTNELGYSQTCDVTMKKVCVDNYDKSLNYKCKVWFNGIYKRAQTDESTLEIINNIMTQTCRDDVNKHNCILWLDAIRNGNQENFFSIADNIIMSQLDKSQFKCAISPNYILDLEKKYGNKECWYKECSFAEKWKLLTENLVKRNICSLSECSVNIKNLRVDDPSEIDIICDDKKIVSSKFVSDVIHNDMYDNYVFIPSNFILFISLLLMLLISLAR